MRCLERGEDPLTPGHQIEGVERLGIGDARVFDALRVVPPGMLGADAGIVEPRRHRMDVGRLAVGILEYVGEAPMKNAGIAVGEARGMVTGLG